MNYRLMTSSTASRSAGLSVTTKRRQQPRLLDVTKAVSSVKRPQACVRSGLNEASLGLCQASSISNVQTRASSCDSRRLSPTVPGVAASCDTTPVCAVTSSKTYTSLVPSAPLLNLNDRNTTCQLEFEVVHRCRHDRCELTNNVIRPLSADSLTSSVVYDNELSDVVTTEDEKQSKYRDARVERYKPIRTTHVSHEELIMCSKSHTADESLVSDQSPHDGHCLTAKAGRSLHAAPCSHATRPPTVKDNATLPTAASSAETGAGPGQPVVARLQSLQAVVGATIRSQFGRPPTIRPASTRSSELRQALHAPFNCHRKEKTTPHNESNVAQVPMLKSRSSYNQVGVHCHAIPTRRTVSCQLPVSDKSSEQQMRWRRTWSSPLPELTYAANCEASDEENFRRLDGIPKFFFFNRTK